MAPKGGKGGGSRGGGGSHYGSSGSSSGCRSGAFKDGAVIASIVFLSIFLLTFLCLSCITSAKSTAMKKRGQKKSKLLWWPLTLSLTLVTATTILFITTTVLTQCGNDVSSTSILTIVRTWFKNWSVFLLIGVIMVPLCKHLHQLAGKVLGRVVAIGHLVVMTIMAIFLVSYLGLWTSLSSYTSYKAVRVIVPAIKGLNTAYSAVAWLGTCLASASILIATLRSSQIQNSWAKKWILCVATFPIFLTFFDLVYTIHFTVRDQVYTYTAFAVFTCLWNLFYTMSYLGVLYIVSEGSLSPAAQPGPAIQNEPGKGNYAPVQGASQPPFDNTAYNSPMQQMHQQQQVPYNMPPPMGQPGFEPARDGYTQAPHPPQQYYDPVKGEAHQPLMHTPVYEQPAPQYQNYQQPPVPQPYK